MSDDGYVGEEVAARYDEDRSPVSTPAVLQPTVDLLAELARGGRGLELGIGTGIPGMRGHVAQLQRGYGPRPYEGGCAMADRETNKQIVTAFYELAFNGKEPEQAVEKYMGSEYIQHNPQAPDGADAFIGFVRAFPGASVDIRRVIAEGDIVVTHSLVKFTPEDRGSVAADFFRLEDGKIVEHWDVLQPFPDESANPHPMF